jgi:hypothetical protein
MLKTYLLRSKLRLLNRRFTQTLSSGTSTMLPINKLLLMPWLLTSKLVLLGLLSTPSNLTITKRSFGKTTKLPTKHGDFPELPPMFRPKT